MSYSIENLTLVADCNALLFWAEKERADLNHQKYTDDRVAARFEETLSEINAELHIVEADIAAVDYVIPTLSGAALAENRKKKIRLEYKKFVLETRMESYGTVALIKKEMEVVKILKEIEEVEDFIVAIEAKRAELEGNQIARA